MDRIGAVNSKQAPSLPTKTIKEFNFSAFFSEKTLKDSCFSTSNNWRKFKSNLSAAGLVSSHYKAIPHDKKPNPGADKNNSAAVALHLGLR